MFESLTVIAPWEGNLLYSVIVAAIAFGLAYLVGWGRRRMNLQVSPIVTDLVSSILLIAIVVGTALSIAEIWGQTDVLIQQVGFLRLDQHAPEFVLTLVILIAIQVFAGIATRLLDDLTRESHTLTEHQREVGVRVTQLSLWGTGIIIILGVWRIDLTGLLVGAGFLGIVLGLAARKTLGSLLAGFVLMFSQPFEVGDWIVVEGKEGIVSDITLMSTRLQAFNGEYVIVPNDVVSNETIANRSRQGQLRVEVEVGIDYDADIDYARGVALQVARELADDTERGLTSPAPDVLVERFGDSSIILLVRIWADHPSAGEFNRLRDELICRIKDAFDREAIAIPYPQRQLSERADVESETHTAKDSVEETPTESDQ